MAKKKAEIRNLRPKSFFFLFFFWGGGWATSPRPFPTRIGFFFFLHFVLEHHFTLQISIFRDLGKLNAFKNWVTIKKGFNILIFAQFFSDIFFEMQKTLKNKVTIKKGFNNFGICPIFKHFL